MLISTPIFLKRSKVNIMSCGLIIGTGNCSMKLCSVLKTITGLSIYIRLQREETLLKENLPILSFGI